MNRAEKIKDLRAALNAFSSAAQELYKKWGAADTGANDAINEGYPFNISFTDLYLNIAAWEVTAAEKLAAAEEAAREQDKYISALKAGKEIVVAEPGGTCNSSVFFMNSKGDLLAWSREIGTFKHSKSLEEIGEHFTRMIEEGCQVMICGRGDDIDE